MSVALAPEEAPALAERVTRGTAQLGLALEPKQVKQLVDYLLLLVKWSAVYNLTAVRDPERMVTVHLLDSLAVVPVLRQLAPKRLLDVGSGAGLPGIPIAIAMPEVAVTLVEAVQKKVSFQTQVKGALGLSITPIHSRVEALTSAEGYDCITSRAFSSLVDLVRCSSHLLAPGGTLVALKAHAAHAEAQRLPGGFELEGVVPLSVPGLDAERCAVLVKASGTARAQGCA